jgi:hypothetical protein
MKLKSATFDAEKKWTGELSDCHFGASVFGLAPFAISTAEQPVPVALASLSQFQRVRCHFNLMLHLQHEIEIRQLAFAGKEWLGFPWRNG